MYILYCMNCTAHNRVDSVMYSVHIRVLRTVYPVHSKVCSTLYAGLIRVYDAPNSLFCTYHGERSVRCIMYISGCTVQSIQYKCTYKGVPYSVACIYPGVP